MLLGSRHPSSPASYGARSLTAELTTAAICSSSSITERYWVNQELNTSPQDLPKMRRRMLAVRQGSSEVTAIGVSALECVSAGRGQVRTSAWDSSVRSVPAGLRLTSSHCGGRRRCRRTLIAEEYVTVSQHSDHHLHKLLSVHCLTTSFTYEFIQSNELQKASSIFDSKSLPSWENSIHLS